MLKSAYDIRQTPDRSWENTHNMISSLYSIAWHHKHQGVLLFTEIDWDHGINFFLWVLCVCVCVCGGGGGGGGGGGVGGWG